MATKKAATKKTGATKKTDLSLIEGGKGKGKSAVVAPGTPMLADGKTPLNVDAAKRALGVYGVAFKADSSAEDILALLRKTLTKKLKPMKDEEKVKCVAVCGEVATQDTDFCPYCGDEGAEGDDAGAAEAAGAEPPEPKKPETGAPVANVSTATGLAAATTKLDESIARINQLRSNLAGNSYDLGLELRVIHEEELWKAKGRESFKDFIEKDLEISRSMAYRLIEVTREFDRATFESVGSRKLALIGGIQDAEARDAALEAAKAGASTRDVARQASEAKGKSSAPAKEKAAAAAPPKKANEITLLAKVNAKAQLVGFRSASSGRAIAHHKDDAYAEFQLSEDVKQRIALKVDKEGNILGLTVAFVRVE